MKLSLAIYLTILFFISTNARTASKYLLNAEHLGA